MKECNRLNGCFIFSLKYRFISILLENLFGNEEKGDLSTKVSVNEKCKINGIYRYWILSDWINDPFTSLNLESIKNKRPVK
jgi:hypothetical protein